MKKFLFISVVCLMGMMSCSKEIKVTEPQQDSGKITFSAGIIIKEDTKTTLSGLNITWGSSDKILVANSVNDEIQVCAITKDGVDKTKCTFTVDAVAGADTYYAISVGESSTSGITFDHETATFSGFNISKYSFSEGALYDSKIPVAGKSTDKAHFSLTPCLSLGRFRMAEESVAAKYEAGYSGIRGFYLIAKNGDRVIVAGDYTVNLSGEMNVQYVDNSNKGNYKKIESDDLLKKDTDYYFTMIPAGTVKSLELRFVGFNSDGTVSSTEGIYKMASNQTVSFDPGDCFDFGTLNPVGAKKADDSYVPAITIDGVFSDWSASGVVEGTNHSEAIKSWKYISDAKNVYFYVVIPKSKVEFNTKDPSRGYRKDNVIYVGFDYDNNAETGFAGRGGLGAGFDARAVVYPYTGFTNGTLEYIIGKDDRSSTAYHPASESSADWEAASSWETIYTGAAESGDDTIVEFMVPRNRIGRPASGTITINMTFNGGSSIGRETITLN